MKPPKVSICLPNLNTLPFLEERFATIYNQTFQDWELIVYDSFSDDGAWEYIQGQAAAERRMRISQGPREGTPGSWNPCIRQATGDYVYIATSDDTMAPNCLEELVAALNAHPECDIAHCLLKTIDEQGKEFKTVWPEYSLFVKSAPDMVCQPHLRMAPHDGLLHLTGETVYWSITQLLIRRSLFDKVGLFESRWGSVGDFNWDMRAALVANTVHVPQTWGGWRWHRTAATSQVKFGSLEHLQKIQGMIDHAVTATAPLCSTVWRRLPLGWRSYFTDKSLWWDRVSSYRSRLGRWAYICRSLISGHKPAWDYFRWRLRLGDDWTKDPVALVRTWLDECGLGQLVVRLPLSEETTTVDRAAGAHRC